MKILAFCSPNPGRERMRAISSSPLATPVQMASAFPPYSSTTARQTSCTRPAIDPG